jgi:hypothetical protein
MRAQATIPLTYNLVCKDGHRHWSPVPKEFVDRECMTTTSGSGINKCRERLALIKGAK